jgi:hypothetical protein
MARMTVDNPKEIELIVGGLRFPVKFWDTRSSFEEFIDGEVEQKGYIEVGEWLTADQINKLETIMRPQVLFKVSIAHNESSFSHICSLLKSEWINGGYRYHYIVMPGSNILQL